MDYTDLYQCLNAAGAQAWVDLLPLQLEQAFSFSVHGTLAKWSHIIARTDLPEPSILDFNRDSLQIGQETDLSSGQQQQLRADLMSFHPWRKGPYDLFGIHVDTEWRSDWKWQRLKDHIKPLTKSLVLDVGCGNGYHGWRMLGAGAKLVVGIDPTLINVMQFQFIKKLAATAAPIYVLPVSLEDLPAELKVFDTVFSMGVLYHRRSPLEHLLELKDVLKPGGELVLETLVIEGGAGQVLVPEQRYAKMRNVWFLPSCDTLIGWMKRCGFVNIRLININKTGTDEQRSTEWMTFYSLANFLDPHNPNLTCEGLPAPVRAIIIAEVD